MLLSLFPTHYSFVDRQRLLHPIDGPKVWYGDVNGRCDVKTGRSCDVITVGSCGVKTGRSGTASPITVASGNCFNI